MTKDEINAASRHAITALTAVIGTLGAMGLVSASDSKNLTDALTQIGGALGSIATAIGVIVPIVMGFFAQKSSKPNVQLEKAVANNPPQDVLKKIAETPAMGVSEIKAAPAIANSTLTNKVVAS